MADETNTRRSYRSSAPPPEPIVREEVKPEPAPKKEFEKTKSVNVTGFFPSKSGLCDTVFVTDKIAEELHKIQPGDTLGVSENKKTNRLQLFYYEGTEGK
jgi:hypothetical protein